MVPRKALAHYVQWMTDAFDVKPQDRFSQHANLALDLSMNDIFGALCHGATLCWRRKSIASCPPA
jgi:non-ribosomal peptide synthetase component F